MQVTPYRFWQTAVPLLIFMLLLTGARQVLAAPPGQEGPLPMVTVTRIMDLDTTPVTDYVGHVEAIQTVDLRARVEGFVEKINFREGDDVKAGQVLYVIEQAPYKARVDADRARLQQASAELIRAGQHLKRLQDARPEAIPATDLDNAVAAELVAKAQVASAEAALAGSELNFTYTTIMAPISGRIGMTAYTAGNLVGPSSGTLARIVQTDPIRVVYSISENDLASVTEALKDASNGKGKRLLAPQLRLAGADLLPEKGHVTFVDNQVDAATGTIAVRAEFDNPLGRLIPGQYATVFVKESEPRMRPVVPQAAVLVNREGRFVFVVDDKNVVSSRPIVIGKAIDTNWAVESGLTAGEQVIVQGIQKVKPGQTVQTKINPVQEK
ncbi:MAG: efflux RND transporter periplasmic adaptor subunit [Pseudomonadota bacterium]